VPDSRLDHTINPPGFEASADSAFCWEGNIPQQSIPPVCGGGWAPTNEGLVEPTTDRDWSASTGAAAANIAVYQPDSAPTVSPLEAVSHLAGISSHSQHGHVAGFSTNIEYSSNAEIMDGEQAGLHGSFPCPFGECNVQPFSQKGLLT
jgi:hypothetical protein